jgi:hypothetical protein
MQLHARFSIPITVLVQLQHHCSAFGSADRVWTPSELQLCPAARLFLSFCVLSDMPVGSASCQQGHQQGEPEGMPSCASSTTVVLLHRLVMQPHSTAVHEAHATHAMCHNRNHPGLQSASGLFVPQTKPLPLTLVLHDVSSS